ncbi:MAG: DUF4842 domain-containing protein [Bacteroides sp.]|nr:DUF4842 domain-containing protein [Bacteroides sp.]
MKKTLFKSVLCATLFVGALTSCNDIEDLYNPELVREKAKKALGLDIAADQDWNMTSVVTANVTLNEDALSDYSFRIYTADPLDKNSGATILADYPVKTDAQGKASASFKFEMPSYLEYVYVARVDSHGRRMIGLSKIQNGAISKAFGESSSVSTKAVTDYAFPTINFPYTEAEVETLLADAYDLTQGLSNSDGFNGMAGETGKTVAKIAGEGVVCNFANRFDDGGSNKLIIADGATWEIPDNGGILQIKDVDIIVANGGTLKFTGKLQLTGSTRLIVMEGGVVDNTTSVALSNGEYSIKADGTNGSVSIYNAGTLNANYIYADQGAALYNTATGVWKTKTTHCAGGNGWENFINWGKIESDAITSNGDQGTLYNACLIRASKLTVDQLSVNANSAVEVPTIDCNSIYLRENSIVRATTVAPSRKISVNYIGQEGGKALFSAETWELKDSPNNIDSNNVYIEMETFKLNGQTPQDTPWDYTKQVFDKCFPNGKYPIGEAPLIISSEAASSIENADCVGQGNTPKDKVIEELLGSSNIYAFEDMNADGGDYDMNDVVIECTRLENNQISIKLLAAGATKQVYAFFRDKRSNAEPINLFGELHEAFGQPSGIIINTGAQVNNLASITHAPITVDSGFLFSQHGDIYIVDSQHREAHLPQFTEGFQPGDAPYGILVPANWKYPKEWINIATAYPEFAAWAGGDDTASGWYAHPSSSNVY